ncbi:MAG: N-acetyl-1-D-myo-inositol-2-amino-2-deoxy-alpha-D-glucopyranoside deacetylase [Chloroflexi bacterium]|nr:N-acetyl-1-D-myo-inositol-2-amino-2-deoxy-alpha-D-glucopyranoside deacetylase [Chloroflexota bacterium]
MSNGLTLMAVHAHPDDETIAGGMTLARYAAEGVRVLVVTCTGGEEGEIVVPELDTPENHAILGDLRLKELEQALRELGVEGPHMLGFRDSGMAGTSANEHPDSFHQSPFDEGVRRLVRLIRAERPQVLMTYAEDGGYGHPDHVRAHQITVAAYDAAADPAYAPEAGPAWAPLKLYYTIFTRGRTREMWQAMRDRGIPSPWGGDSDTPPERGQPDERVTTRIAVQGFSEQRRRALIAHRTQIKLDRFNMGLPADLAERFMSEETFACAQSRISVEPNETDLFAGVRPAEG